MAKSEQPKTDNEFVFVVQLVPLFVETHKPPAPVPAKTVLGNPGIKRMNVIRPASPPTGEPNGPIAVQFPEVELAELIFAAAVGLANK